MSTQTMITAVITTTEANEEFLISALRKAGVVLSIEQRNKPTDPLKLFFPSNIVTVSVFIHAIESNPTAFAGQVTMPDGQVFSLDDNGRLQLKRVLSEAMKQPQQPVQSAPWWMYFQPQIGQIITEMAGLVKWYPRAIGDSQKKVTIAFMMVVIGIVIGTGVLAQLGTVSGDAFVFVVGILLGYIFAFLSKFLGLAGS